MREIKFRAWDKKTRTFIPEKLVTINMKGNIILCNVDGFERNIVLMQFTGLLDKFGKEIYEGDVVEFLFDRGNGKEKENAKVEWTKYTGYEPFSTYGIDPRRIFIIGNVYTNPKLKKLLK